MQSKVHSLIQSFVHRKSKPHLFAMLALSMLLLRRLTSYDLRLRFRRLGFLRSPWQVNRGEGIVDLGRVMPNHGHPDLYDFMNIPAVDDAGWGEPPLDADGNIFIEESSALIGKQCRRWADFTYYQTQVTIPDGAAISEFVVRFQTVDDGARAYIFNSEHPDGAFIPGGDIAIFGNPTAADLSSLVVVGETNRVVIVQADDCPDENSLKNAQLFVNGTVAAEIPDTTYYVDLDADGSATGASWTDAFTTLQDALAVVSDGDQIWVAEGVYYPDMGGGQIDNDRSASFRIPSGVALYGGFAGNETSFHRKGLAE